MGWHTIPNTGDSYGLIAYDVDGTERQEAGKLFSQELIHRAASEPITDVFFYSHGWQGDAPAARDQYNRWIGAVVQSADHGKAQQLNPNFRPMWIGLHWPSLPWGDETARSDGSFSVGASQAPKSLLASYLERLGDTAAVRGPLEMIVAEARRNMKPDSLPPEIRKAYQDLNDGLGLGSEGVDAPPDADREGFDPDEAFDAGNEAEEGESFGGWNLGGLLGPLRQLSYWTMKKRARSVGEGGMHQFLVSLQRATAQRRTRIHLMGHSFGTIVVSSMIGGPQASASLERPINSVALIQGAVSLWCYASSIPFNGAGAGYFSRILSDGKIAGPLVTTQSRFDHAVGRFYPLASRLRGSATFGADLPEYGAIGTYGIKGLASNVQFDQSMLPSDGSYQFSPGKVYNLEGSKFIFRGDGISGAHSDIDGPEVAHAIWSAAIASP